MPSLITSDVVVSWMSWNIEGLKRSSYLCCIYTSEKETVQSVGMAKKFMEVIYDPFHPF